MAQLIKNYPLLRTSTESAHIAPQPLLPLQEKFMKTFNTFLVVATMLAGTAQAASHTGVPTGAASAKTTVATTSVSDMAVGEIRKIDLQNNKVTIKHGEIKNLDMPGMTMVFQVKDATMLTNFKAGDSVHFKAAKTGGAIVITEIQMASSSGTAQVTRPATQPTGVMAPVSTTKKEAAAATAEMTLGEVRKVDLANSKVTIKHEEIKNLDMPGMTMVFQVKDADVLAKAKAGDTIRFKAEKSGGAMVVTDIQPAK